MWITNSGNLRRERIYLGGFEIWRRYDKVAGNWVLDDERETVHISDDHRRICMIESLTVDGGSAPGTITPRRRFQFDNHLGTACVETDHTGAVISYEEYHPYGTSSYRSWKTGAEVSAKRYRYTGKERDEETSLYYHGARYYAPWLGRWMSADPAGTVDGSNLFAYVRGSPVVLSDPSGTQGMTERSFSRPQRVVWGDPSDAGSASRGVGGVRPQGLKPSPASPAAASGGGTGAGGADPGTGQEGAGPGTDPIPKPAPELYYPTDEELKLQPEKQFGQRKTPVVTAAPAQRQATPQEDLADVSATIGLLPGPVAETTAAGIDVGIAASDPTFNNVAQAAASVTAIFLVGVGSGWLRHSGLLDEGVDVAGDLAHHELPDVPTPRTAEEIAAHQDYLKHADEAPPPSRAPGPDEFVLGGSDWKGYPSGQPKPGGPFRLLEGAEYDAARKAADKANTALRKADPAKYAGKQIHEIHPIKFGGSPTDPANKIALDPTEHAQFTTFWNRLMRKLR